MHLFSYGVILKKLFGVMSFVLGIFSTVVISMGSPGFLGKLSDSWSDWGDVAEAYSLMQNFARTGKNIGFVRSGEPGFNVLADVIGQNVTTVHPRSITDIVIVHTATFGGIKEQKVQVLLQGGGNSLPIADFPVFQSWVSQAKSQDYLYSGLFWLFLAFVFGLLHHIVEDDA